MTTGTYSNYASTVAFPSGTMVTPCRVVGFPSITSLERSVTNNAGGGFTESAPSGLIEVGEVTIELLATPGKLSTFKTHQTSKTVACLHLSDTVNNMVVDAWVMEVVPEAADQEAPDSQIFTVTFKPTGAIGIS
jgi:hypothetical protein